MNASLNHAPAEFPCPGRFKPKAEPAARLLRVVGLEKFLEIQEALGGTRVCIPSQKRGWPCGLCRFRNRCIRGWRAQGHSASSIAKYLGLSTRTVQGVLRGAKGRA